MSKNITELSIVQKRLMNYAQMHGFDFPTEAEFFNNEPNSYGWIVNAINQRVALRDNGRHFRDAKKEILPEDDEQRSRMWELYRQWIESIDFNQFTGFFDPQSLKVLEDSLRKKILQGIELDLELNNFNEGYCQQLLLLILNETISWRESLSLFGGVPKLKLFLEKNLQELEPFVLGADQLASLDEKEKANNNFTNWKIQRIRELLAGVVGVKETYQKSTENTLSEVGIIG